MSAVVDAVREMEVRDTRVLSDTDFGRTAPKLGAAKIKERAIAIAAEAQRGAESHLEDSTGRKRKRRDFVLRTTIGVLARQLAMVEQAMRPWVS